MDWGKFRFVIEDARIQIGDDNCQCLKMLFESSSGVPLRVEKDRFRLANRDLIPLFNQLENELHLLKTARDGKAYVLPAHALTLFDSPKVSQLFEAMDKAFDVAQKHYEGALDAHLHATKFIQEIDCPKQQVLEALSCLCDCRVFNGVSTDFPTKNGSYVTVSEDVVTRSGLAEFITDPLRWANLTNSTLPVSYLGLSIMDAPEWAAEWFLRLSKHQQLLLRELDMSLQAGGRILPTIAIRTLLESLMINAVEDQGSFKKNLSAFEQLGHLTHKEVELMAAVIDTGHATTHRLFVPSTDDLRTCCEVVKHLLQRIVLSDKIHVIKANTPPRPSRKPE